MAKEFKLQDPGEGIHEAEILEVHIAESEDVEQEDILLTIETDKAAVEIPSPFEGTVEEIHVREGDIVRVGDVLITYTEAGVEEEATEPEDEGREPEYEGQEPEYEGEEAEGEGEEAEPQKTSAEGEVTTEAEPAAAERPVPAAPATRRLARELDVDLRQVEPSGPGGRVTAEDVRSAAGAEEAEPAEAPAEERAEQPSRPPIVGVETPPLPDFSQWGEVERVPLRSIRRVTARQMALAWREIPHVTHWDVADITELERFRLQHQETVEKEGGRLTLTALVMKAAIAALKEFPRFNATLDPENQEIILKRYYHIGVAVATGRGLVVPVIRDVDCKNVLELAVELTHLAERAREGEVQREEMLGGTFTITNPGPLGGTAFTPIINHPQVAILGLARARLEPVLRGDLESHELEPRLRLPLGLAFDHRVNDGAEAAKFVNSVMDALSDPETLLLST